MKLWLEMIKDILIWPLLIIFSLKSYKLNHNESPIFQYIDDVLSLNSCWLGDWVYLIYIDILIGDTTVTQKSDFFFTLTFTFKFTTAEED
jgi:hypothetical protein